MARFVDPKEILRAEHAHALAVLRARFPQNMRRLGSLRYRFLVWLLGKRYARRKFIMWWLRTDTAAYSFVEETPEGLVEIAVSVRGDVEIFLIGHAGKATKRIWDLVSTKAQLAESLRWVGVPEGDAQLAAARIWSTAGVVPRRFPRLRRFVEAGITPGPVWYGGPGF